MIHSSTVISKKGFTLVELMIVIVIIAILSIGAYVPYNYYSQLAQVRISGELVRQSINDAKMLSTNGYVFPGSSSNADIGLVFRKSSGTIEMLAFQSGSVSFTESPSAKLVRSVSLENKVEISGLPSDPFLVHFAAPNATIRFYRQGGELSETWATVRIWWKGTSSWALTRTETIEKNY